MFTRRLTGLQWISLNLASDFRRKKDSRLRGQIRRSSRSVCLNLREAWAKRRYEAHFVSKLTDCDGENSETDSSLDFAKDCSYVTDEQHRDLVQRCAEVGRMLGSMVNNPTPFLIRSQRPEVRGQRSEVRSQKSGVSSDF